MANLSRSEISLLEKLYNLRGEDSTILKDIEREEKEAEALKEQKEEESKNLDEQISALKETIETLENSSKVFIDMFKDVKTEDFATLITEIKLEFNPVKAVEYVQKQTPPTIEVKEKEKELKEDRLKKLKDEVEDIKLKLAESERDRETAKTNSENLNKLLDEILEGNRNITAQALTDLLKELKLTEAECNEAGKLLLFSDALAQYDEMLKTKDAKKVETIKEPEPTPIEPEQEEPKVEAEDDKYENSGAGLDELDKLLGSQQNKEEVNDAFSGLRDDYTPVNDVEKTTSQAPAAEDTNEAKTILEELKLPLETNADLLADEEFVKKYEFLRVYAPASDIAENMQSIRGNSYQSLVEKEKKLNDAGISPAILPLSVFEDNNAENYVTNNRYVNAKGFALDENETFKQAAVLYTDSTIFAKNLDTAMLYGMNLKKNNGKLAVDALAQNTEELVDAMDKAIENSEEAILESAPEFLAKDIDGILKRIKTLKVKGISYRSDEGKYKNALGNPEVFKKALGADITEESLLVSKEENNTALAARLTTSNIIDILSLGALQFLGIPADPKSEELINKVASLGDTSTYSYKLAGVHFSKKKFERNVMAVVQGLTKAGSMASDEEILFASLVYNSNKNEEEMKMVAETLGFSIAMGGIGL